MSNTKASPASPDAWRRPSGRIALRSSGRNTDYSKESLITKDLFRNYQQEIKEILDFRKENNVEQYLVAWESKSSGDIEQRWEAEEVVEKSSWEMLRKFWLRVVLDTPKVIAGSVLSTVKEIFRKKLMSWMDEPWAMRLQANIETSHPINHSKKRRSPRIEITENLDQIFSKQPKLNGSCSYVPNRGGKISNNRMMSDTRWNAGMVKVDPTEDLGDFIDAPQREADGIIYKNPLFSPTGSENSVSSDDASTHPPSVNDFTTFETKVDLSSYNHIAAVPQLTTETQTDIKLNPHVCLYCQKRLGEGERLLSLRQRNVKKEAEEEAKKALQNAVVKKEKVDEVDGEEMVDIEYEVEHILDYQRVEGTNEEKYNIHWKGFHPKYDTWEPPENLINCEKALVIFYVERVATRRKNEVELQKMIAANGSSAARKFKLPELPPLPDVLMNQLSRKAPISDQEVEMAFKASRTVKKNTIWSKRQLRQVLLEMIGEWNGPKRPKSQEQSKNDLSVVRHQLLMIESQRRKDLVLKELKDWETQLNKIARGRPEIVVENNFDLTGPPKDFKYINDNIIGEGVTFRDDPLEGCQCEDSCVKDKSQCCPGKHDKVLAYNIYKRLRVHPGYPIYECNKHCKCGPDCGNRVVQDGTMSLSGTKLCIFRTKNDRGWGVKTLKKIKKGSFVCLYAGEIITTEQAENRGQIYENLLGASYLFDLDYYDYDDEESESCPYTIDATKMGNVAHFINHSCDPNLCVFNVWADCVDQNLPKLAFFALREINRDEELTYDYGTHDEESSPTTPGIPYPSSTSSSSKVFMTPTKRTPSKVHEDDEEEDILDPALLTASPAKNRMKPATMSAVRKACLCGSKNCRKVLF